MYNSEILLDIHSRSHRGLRLLIEYCAQFSVEQLTQEHPGFGYASIHSQILHVIGAEKYWFGVLQGRMDVDLEEENYPTVDLIEAFRSEVSAASAQYLKDSSPEELSQERSMVTWGGTEQPLIPAHIVLRTQTHIFQHQGQVTAMCRLMDAPVGGLDYPVKPQFE